MMGEERVVRVEWTIENFSYWNQDIHGKKIENDVSIYNPGIHLYPRGLSGEEDQLVVYISHNLRVFSGELSMQTPTGAFICTQDFWAGKGEKLIKLPPGPKFERVQREDVLVLCCNLKNNSLDRVHLMRTMIEVFETPVKITSAVLDGIFKSSVPMHVSTFEYPRDGGTFDSMRLSLVPKDSPDYSEIQLSLEPTSYKDKISVITLLSFLTNGKVIKMDKNEHMFEDGKNWMLPNLLKIEEATTKEFSLLLNVKIIPRNRYKHSSYFPLKAATVHILPKNNTSKHPSSSDPAEDRPNKILKTGDSTQPRNSVHELTKDLTRLYKDQDFSDLELRCENVSFHVHKNILSVRSPVFKCLAKETSDGPLDIADVDALTLSRFLGFLYTGTLEDLEWDSALKLYSAADKYQVPSLKTECASVICEDVSQSNVCNVLQFAEKHGYDQLISAAHDFILDNYHQVLGSGEWTSLVNREPLLVSKTLTHFAVNNHVRKSNAIS